MKSELRKCGSCGRYTLSADCPSCGSKTHCPVPPKYSPVDRMGEYRRKTILERYGENGKHDHHL
ncbi:MAG: RNA-protein complex protein Nop10 [Candidatus Methanomethylophilaceae archaeon]|nr:RNA-protein complex protein Nop10 [Candidatus Methanomethylophilaceae archaeon]